MQIRLRGWQVAACVLVFLLVQLGLYKTYGAIRIYRGKLPTVTVTTLLDSAKAPSLAIGFIGDSISSGGDPSVPILVGKLLNVEGGIRNVAIVNCAKGGTSAEQWMPDDSSGYFRAAAVQFKAKQVSVVSMMVGTNTSRSIEPSLRATILALQADGFRVILHCPGWSKFQTDGGNAVRESVDHVIADGLAERGDTEAADYFRSHPEELEDGVHQTAAGREKLAVMWAYAIARRLETH